MIAIDTSALIAILRKEEKAAECLTLIEGEANILISAGTLAEALIVASGYGMAEQMRRLIDEYGLETIPVTAASARRIGDIYAKWGKGFHPAGLNYGDCFAYELADSRNCKLLFIGHDFSKTDITPALA